MSGPRATALVAPDSFKGTFSASRVAAALARGCERAGLRADVCPLADGGEGTAAVLLDALGGRRLTVTVHDPLGRPVDAELALLGDGRLAVVEVAAASGLALLEPAELDPWRASSRGTGELIAAAAELGAREVLIAAGGSATVDGGAGAIEALAEASPGSLPALTVLCDVKTTWERCAAVYGPQKGAEETTVARLERRLARFANSLPRDPTGVPMGGAAGGLSGGLWAFGAELRSGSGYLFDAVALLARMRGASLVITGEGRLDTQSAMGKVVGELARRTAEAGVPLYAVVGCDERPRAGFPLNLQGVVAAGTLEAIEAAARRIVLTAEGGSASLRESQL